MLYALIETLQDRVIPENDATVTAVVVHLCKAGYAKFLNVTVLCNTPSCTSRELHRGVPGRSRVHDKP
jgi:hypothetical protein